MINTTADKLINAETLIKEMNVSAGNLTKKFELIMESMGKSVEIFRKNEEKERKKYDQLKMAEMKKELATRYEINREIIRLEKKLQNEKRELIKDDQKQEKALLTIFLKERQRLEIMDKTYRSQVNKQFYRKVDEGFSKLNDRTAKFAGKLDSVLGTNLFTSLQKVSTLITGFTKNVFKIGMGGIKFIQTASQSGIGKAFQQTKIGKGVRKAKIVSKKARRAIGDFIGVGKEKKGGAAERMALSRKEEGAQETQKRLLRGTTKAAEAGKLASEEQNKFFKWFRIQWLLKWLWEKAKGAFDAVKTAASFLALPVAIGAVVGFVVNRGITALANTIARNADKQQSALVKQSEKEKATKDLGKEKWEKIGLSGDQQKKITTQAAQNLLKKDKLYKEERMHLQELGEKFNKGKASEKEIEEMNRLNYSITKKLEDEKDKVYKKQIKGNKEKEKIFDDTQKQYKDSTIKQRKGFIEDEEKDKLMRKAELIRKMKPTSGAALAHLFSFGLFGKSKDQEQKEIYEQLKNQKDSKNKPIDKPTKGFAQGTAGTGHPQKASDLFREAKGTEHITIHDKEKYAVLNKDQYDKIKEQLNMSNISSVGKFLKKGIGGIFGFAKKLAKGAVKGVGSIFGKALSEPENPDEFKDTFGAPIDKGVYKKKDSSVDVEGLQSSFKNRVLMMLKEYKAKTGKTAQVNSAYRDPREQMALYRKDPNKAAKPGSSPHEKGLAMDINSIYLLDMKDMGLVQKYGLRMPAKTKSGAPETWHVQAKEGAAFANAPKDFLMQGHKGEGVFAAKSKEFQTVFQYFEMGKKLAEETTGATKNMSLAFAKDKPGQSLKELQQKGTTMVENKVSNEMVKILTDIKGVLGKGQKTAEQARSEAKPKQAPAGPGANLGAVNYKTRSEVFPSDTLMTNMYAMMTQFSGGY